MSARASFFARFAIAFFASLLPGSASAMDAVAVLKREPVSPSSIQSLVVRSGQGFQVEVEPSPFAQQPFFVRLNGIFSDSTATLVVNGWRAEVGPQGAFSVTVRIHGRSQPVDFVAVDRRGMTVSEQMVLETAGYADLRTELETARKRRHFFTFALGLSSLQFRQTFQPDYSSLALTPKASWDYGLGSLGGGWARWVVGADAYGNAISLNPSPSTISARLIGADARIGYQLTAFDSPWSLRIFAGISYSRMLVTGDLFGYGDLFSPQLYPVLRRSWSTANSAYIYAKYIPLTSNVSLGDAQEREIGVGGGLELSLRGRRILILSVDYSDCRLIFAPGVGITADSATVSVGVGF